MRRALILGAGCALALCTHAAPYIPADNAQVIERLPAPSAPLQRELGHLRAALAADPGNLPLAVRLARRCIGAARADGDPRYLGYAQAALSRWWNLPQPPEEVRILRATLLQSAHRFDEALADLDAVLRANPRHAQAWLTKAGIHLARGDHAQAKNSCIRLRALAGELVAIACAADAAGRTGQAAQSAALLSSVLPRHTHADEGIRLWAMTLLAETEARAGDYDAADRHFRQARAIAEGDSYLLAAYADFLLDRDRAREVVALLKDKGRNDGLLLRHAIALKRLGDPATQQIDDLRARFAAATLRGDASHQREQARFALQLLGDPGQALALAQRNWAEQKEPADARILLEAALALDDAGAARPVLAWLRQTNLEDRALETLAAQFEGRR